MLKEFLASKRDRILQNWLEITLSSYHTESTKFFKNIKDQIRNPVGMTISNELDCLYDLLITEDLDEAAKNHLQEIIKIRAVQDFTPSQAVAFVFGLKDAIGKVLSSEPADKIKQVELDNLYRRIDHIALLAFDCYMESREKINNIRVSEIKNRSREIMAASGSSIRVDHHCSKSDKINIKNNINEGRN